ncbi:hypothetical protein [Chryseobacterium sp.]|uniref:hypothetical protein n=1 Tax=Chryseobacterium sp. TaxID=1871047 RepID=UPI00388FAB77
MKNIIGIFITGLVIFSCNKKTTENTNTKSKEELTTDSINAARNKINDSIKILNNKNRFKDFEGQHQFSHELFKKSGTVSFKKIGRDEYEISGKAQSGNNEISIDGTGIFVSDKHLNFTGNITQKIGEYDNGKPYVRKGTKTFLSKDGGKTWRLQDMVNDSGFIDHIDIKF